jgi:hypothetical protein
MSIALNRNSIVIPHGQEASFEEMQACGNILQTFIRDQEALLPSIANDNRHNEVVDYLLSLANGYNEQLRIFKQVEKEHQRQLIAALMQFATK